MNRTEFLEKRRTGIGGSDAAKIAGVSRWGTPYDVWADKMGIAPDKKTTAMEIGTALEPWILDKYKELTGNDVQVGFDTFRDKTHSFIMANIDGLVSDKNLIVEAKTARTDKEWGEEGTCDIPVDYLCQVAHYCYVLDASKADIIVFFKNVEKLKLYHYERNQELEEQLLKKEVDFWNNHILKKNAPPITTVNQAKVQYSYADNLIAIADKKTEISARKLKEINLKIKDLEKVAEKLKVNIMASIGMAKRLESANGELIATWDNFSRSHFDASNFKKNNPGLYNEYLKTISSRRFLLK